MADIYICNLRALIGRWLDTCLVTQDVVEHADVLGLVLVEALAGVEEVVAPLDHHLLQAEALREVLEQEVAHAHARVVRFLLTHI